MLLFIDLLLIFLRISYILLWSTISFLYLLRLSIYFTTSALFLIKLKIFISSTSILFQAISSFFLIIKRQNYQFLIYNIDMYINFMTDENKNIYISFWLLLAAILVVLMIIIGGLTRLTDSGLSITQWELFSGILPPFNLNDWNQLFSLYQLTTEYKLLNSSMNLEEFKIIYWWEYVHRL